MNIQSVQSSPIAAISQLRAVAGRDPDGGRGGNDGDGDDKKAAAPAKAPGLGAALDISA